MGNRITLKDVAMLAGVSVTTVSNVVRGWPYIAEDTRQKVQEAIAELGYSPHPIAQGLRTGQMQTIGFVVPDISNPYFASIVSVAEDVAQEHQYTVIIFSSHEDPTRQTECIRRAANRMVDGLLIAPVATTPLQSSDFRNLTVPMVLIDRVPQDYTGASCALNNFRVGQMATEHLYQLGHRRIAHISGPPMLRAARERAAGYQHVIRQYALPYERIAYASKHWGCEDGYQQMRQLLTDSEPPTAIFAGNDLVAIGVLHALDEAGIATPQQMSVVGVDDIEVGAYMQPTLTTVSQPIREMARTGIELLLMMIRHQDAPIFQHVLEPQLIARHSSIVFSSGKQDIR